MTVEVGRLSEQHGGGRTDQPIEKQAGWEEQSTTPSSSHTDTNTQMSLSGIHQPRGPERRGPGQGLGLERAMGPSGRIQTMGTSKEQQGPAWG